ncbi:MAG: peptidoglycan-binding protein [Candidatus Peregrinibacteria bacterium]|nr:peptidoglycan-binding protein [Candidatus Peregrinibacteria bacterium]
MRFVFVKKVLSVIILVGILIPTLNIEAAEIKGGTKHNFTITGYYSPLPNQNFYVTGSYEAEIRLNGKGRNGADGTPVYPGMMAGHGGFEFGTKVCVPNFGCGAIHDRGQAIVKKGVRDLARNDRLDLWMGYGEEGLLRALAWGVKDYECEIFSADSPIQDSVNFQVPLSLYAILNIPNKEYFNVNLGRGAEGEEVERLQEALVRIGIYYGNIDGIYDYDLENVVFMFQKKYFILETIDDVGAGVFGPQTRRKLADEVYHLEVQDKIREAWESFHFDENLKRGARNEDVVKLQEILVKNEFMHVYPTGYFGPKTEAALKEFQLAYEIIDSVFDYGAGRVGEKTRKKLNEVLVADRESVAFEKSEILAYQKSRKKLQYFASRNFKVNDVLVLGSSGDEVNQLQGVLNSLGYLKQLPSGIYGKDTQAAVRSFQMDYGVITKSNDRGAGVFGPQTNQILNNVLRG